MAATVLVREKNTAGETATDKTSGTVRFKTADDANVDNNAPMVKPAAGSNWSYQKFLRLDASVGPAGQITSPRFYTDGSQSNTGVTMYAKTTNLGAFATPALESAATGYTDAFTYTSGSSKALDAVNAGPFTGTGDFGDYLKLAMAVTSSVSAPGALTGETMTFAWDET
jgi:hypothetical protein